MTFEKESETLEYKKSTGELKAAMIAVSAMLNKHGVGTVYFGIKPDGEVVGQGISQDTLRDVSRSISESIRPKISPSIAEEEIDGKSVIKVTVEGNDQPYSTNGKYYIRTADENREVEPNMLRQLFLDSEKKEKWERQKTDVPASEVDTAAIQRLCENAMKIHRLSISDDSTPDVILKRFGLVSDGFLNNAGNVLFGKNHPVTLKAAVFATDEKLTFLDIKLYEDNILNLLDDAEKYIESNIRWRAEIVGMSRVNTPEIPVDAIREAVANSFAHAVYSGGTYHEICVFPGKVTIYSPGRYASSKTPEEYIENGEESVIRNPLIAKMLFLNNSIESFGSGFRRIDSICRDAGVRYSFEMSENGFKVVFYRNNPTSVSGDERVEKRAVLKLGETETAVYALLVKNGSYTREELATRTSKTVRTIQRALDSLRMKGLIKRVGGNRNGYWEIL